MTRLTIDLDALADLIERMSLFGDQLARVHDDVDGRLRGLRWTGEAAAAQAAAHAQWSAAVRELHAALGTLRSIATTAHSNYASAAAANRRMWAS
jgi:uncharacterized protein YukE